jgi:hypothetical protein
MRFAPHQAHGILGKVHPQAASNRGEKHGYTCWPQAAHLKRDNTLGSEAFSHT